MISITTTAITATIPRMRHDQAAAMRTPQGSASATRSGRNGSWRPVSSALSAARSAALSTASSASGEVLGSLTALSLRSAAYGLEAAADVAQALDPLGRGRMGAEHPGHTALERVGEPQMRSGRVLVPHRDGRPLDLLQRPGQR